MKELLRENVIKFREGLTKTLIDDVKVIDAKDVQTVLNINDDNIKVYIKLKEGLKEGDIGEGFKVTKHIEELGNTIVEVDSVREKYRDAEIVAKYGGVEKTVYGFKGKTLDKDGNIVDIQHTIDESWVESIQQVIFVNPPIEERVDTIQKELEKFLPNLEEKKRDLEYEWKSRQRDIEELRKNLTRKLSRAQRLSLEISALEGKTVTKDFKNDILNLSKHPLFKDLEIRDNKIIFLTDYIDIIDPQNPSNVFLGNKWEISIKMSNGDIRLKGLDKTRCHESCWSDYDPHPHVSYDGSACWGNVSTTLAQLVDEKEIFALFIMITNYLSTFNIEDTAGKRIKNWETKDGSPNPFDNRVKCSECGELHEREDSYTCEECGVVLCSDCYKYNDSSEKYLCPTHYEESLYRCTECGVANEYESEGEYCTECGEWVCSDCLENAGGEYYCPSCFKDLDNGEEEESEEEQEEETTVEVELICENCSNQVDELVDWINEDGSIVRICENCVQQIKGGNR